MLFDPAGNDAVKMGKDMLRPILDESFSPQEFGKSLKVGHFYKDTRGDVCKKFFGEDTPLNASSLTSSGIGTEKKEGEEQNEAATTFFIETRNSHSAPLEALVIYSIPSPGFEAATFVSSLASS